MSRNQKKPTHPAWWGPARWTVALLTLSAPLSQADVPLNEALPADLATPADDIGLPASSSSTLDGSVDSRCRHGGAQTLRISPGSDLVGKNQFIRASQKDSLYDLACRYNVGVEEIFLANDPRNIDHWLPGDGTEVLIPEQFILPDAPRAGIVVNIPEMRMYFFPVRYSPVMKKLPPPPKPKPVAKAKPGDKGKPGEKGKHAAQAKAAPPPPPPRYVETGEVGEPLEQASTVISFPVSMGRMDWRTPIGKTRIIAKVKDPTWTPPESIRREHAAKGDILPAVVPAGPENPLGRFALRLGVAGYLLHGTEENFKSFGIGMRVTHGCMRMYNEDVARLFPMVSVGTPVYLVNQPIKLGWQGDRLFLEASRPLDEDVGLPVEKEEEDMTEEELAREEAKTPEQHKAEEQQKARARSAYLQKLAMDLIQKQNAKRPILLDREALRNALATPTGTPVEIGKAEPPPPPPVDAAPSPYPPTDASPAPAAPAVQAPSAAPRYPYGAPGQPTTQPRPVPNATGGNPRPAAPSAPPVASQPRYGNEQRPAAQPGQALQYPYGTGQGTPRPATPPTHYPYGASQPTPRPVAPAAQYPYGSAAPAPRAYPPRPSEPVPAARPVPAAPEPYAPDPSVPAETDAPDPYAPDDEEEPMN